MLSLIGLLTLAAPAIIATGRPTVTVLAEARTLARNLRELRQTAIQSGRVLHFVLDQGSRGYTGVNGKRRTPGADITFELTNRAGAEDTIIFSPDGSASGGTVRVSSPRGGSHVVSVHWLSGRVSVDD